MVSAFLWVVRGEGGKIAKKFSFATAFYRNLNNERVLRLISAEWKKLRRKRLDSTLGEGKFHFPLESEVV
jgi:hypothetical protein